TIAPPGDAAVGTGPPKLDDARVDVAVFDHHRVVEHGHVRHAAVAMARVEIAAEDGVLLRRGDQHPHLGDEVAVAVEHAPHVPGGPEVLDHHPDRHARATGLARRPVG